MSELRYGIIGCGMMGHEHMRNIALLDDARVSAIYEPDAAMAQSAQSYAPDVTLCESADALIRREDVDCLLVVSPNHMHAGQLVQIAETRPLPLLMEKPLFTDPKDQERMASVAQTYPAPIWVAMEYRYMPPIAAFIEQLETATGGPRMLTIREHRFPFLEKVGDWNRFNRNSGGTLVEKCCHFFDLMRHCLKSDPVRVMASGGQDVNHLDETYNGEVPDIWDAAYVIVDFANGARAMLDLCMYAEGATYQEEMAAVGPMGKIEAKVPGPTRFWSTSAGEPPVPQLVVSPRSPKGPKVHEIPVDPNLLTAGDHNGSTFYQHQRFQQAARGAGPCEVTLEDGIWAVRMGMAAQKSAMTGQVVVP